MSKKACSSKRSYIPPPDCTYTWALPSADTV
eukprot:CAMPEP_0113714520 /NCGR_PEP_ID=MMETSP0038_2-20120614/32667_1 /TAXON_ID=2898 /ORGANISM="Cryptomonas paramecium" /LENGTH=30 /DNA_ID=CAMNT_0000641515 /DNA_START=631 /DNA_END=720 /DNA_ORIENTATION=- /assembly_acc=CAM_ASM_000170